MMKDEKCDLKQLKIELISRYYPFTEEEIIRYKDKLNCGQYGLMENKHIRWNATLIEHLQDNLEWIAFWKLRTLIIDYDLYKRYSDRIEYNALFHLPYTAWDDRLKSEFNGEFFVNIFGKYHITHPEFLTVEVLRKYKDKIDWKQVSRIFPLPKDYSFYDEFYDYFNWSALSGNKSLPCSIDFINRYKSKLSFNGLSLNSAALPLIYKYPQSSKWNWDNVVLNGGFVYNHSTFDFFFEHFNKARRSRAMGAFFKAFTDKDYLKLFIYHLFSHYSGARISYFYTQDYIDMIPWEKIAWNENKKLPFALIDKYKHRIDFKSKSFLRVHKNVITADFIKKNLQLFDNQNFVFYELPLSIQILKDHFSDFSWFHLSGCETLDWTWDFIEANFEKFHYYKLAKNKGAYERLKLDLNDLF